MMEENLEEWEEYDARLLEEPPAWPGKSARSVVVSAALDSRAGMDVRESPFLLAGSGEIAFETESVNSPGEGGLGTEFGENIGPFLSNFAQTSEVERFEATEYQAVPASAVLQEHEDFHTDRFPQRVRDAFAKTDSGGWRQMLKEAIAAGLKEVKQLAYLIFFMQHRERVTGGIGKLIDQHEPDFVKLRAECNLYATYVTERLNPGFSPSVFLPANPSADYLEYVDPPTSGRMTPMFNGMTSGKPWTEAFNAMQTAVESLGTNDSVYLSAFMFNPTKLTVPRTGMNTWGDLILQKAQQGVKFRLLISGIPKEAGWRSDLRELNSLIGRLPLSMRNNLQYIVSMHPAQLNFEMQFGLDHSKPLPKPYLKSVKTVETGGTVFDVGTHHQKFMVVKKGSNAIAFCGGLDISPERTPPWSVRQLIWHDSHAMLEGLIARDLEKEFVRRWNREKDRPQASSPTDRSLIETLSLSAGASGQAINNNIQKLQMVRTVSVGAKPGDIRRDDVWQAYFKLIGSAKNFIYIENQYLHEPFLARAIVKQAENASGLIAMLVISQVTDDPNNPFTEHGLAQQHECFSILTAGISKDRLRIYNMEGRLVHSKVIMVDDRALCMGSTNADPRDFFMDTQLNVVLEDGEAVTAFRHKLWSHDLGLSPEVVKKWKVSEFLAKWDELAKYNESLKAPRERLSGEGVKRFDITRSSGKRFPIADVLTEVSGEATSNETEMSWEVSPGQTEVQPEFVFENEIDGAKLEWSAATPQQMEFMRAVYARHVANAKTRRPYISNVPATELASVESGQSLRKEAARSCVSLLKNVRGALAAAQAAGDSLATQIDHIRVISGYRSASEQFAIWQRNFPKYYARTAPRRASMLGGPLSSEAISYQAAYIGNRVAAPGFSNHNSGEAVDLGADLTAGRRLKADSGEASITLWRGSWLFQWLSRNAATYGFFQNTSINEPWHWEFRNASATSLGSEHPVAQIPHPQSSQHGNLDSTFPAGNRYISHAPVLSKHRGTQPDLYMCWNRMASVPAAVDVVVHLHGHSSDRGGMLLKSEVTLSGLDFSDPSGSGSGRARPTVGIIPRGDYEPRPATKQRPANPDVYGFPALTGPAAMMDLIKYVLGEFASVAGASTLLHNRLILTCHSGGGDWLGAILQHFDPDEIHLFDAIYGVPQALLTWMGRHLAADDGGTPGNSAFRMFFTNSHSTTPHATKIAEALHAALGHAKHPEVLAPYFRVEATTVGHLAIPRTFGWQLLVDASVGVKNTRQI